MAGSRATGFGAGADEYDRLRPAPDPRALDLALPAGAGRVLDLAAGTGLVTRAVRARPDAPVVVAVEPDPRMLARLGPDAGVHRACGVAEAIPLGDAAVDAVLASSAWHWFDPPAATAEIARVLRPGGALGLLWSRPDVTVDWVREIRALARSASDGSAGTARRGFDVELPPGHPLTGTGDGARRFAWHRTLSRDDVAAMVCTYSGVLALDEPGRARVHAEVRARLDAVGPDDDPVVTPFETVVRRWTRD